MNNSVVDTTSYSDLVAGADSFAEQGRRRAETEREAVEWAIGELERLVGERGVDLEPMLEYVRRSRESLPQRHREAYEAMAGVFDVDTDVYAVYTLAYTDLCEALADGIGRSEKHPKGCTNVLVGPSKVETDGGFDVGSSGAGRDRESERATTDGSNDGHGPLILKNRDIAGRGTRPKSVVEQPPIDDYYGFLTVDTCGTVLTYKGVNDQGLVAANTYVESSRADVDPEVQLRNGTVVRLLLEECANVDEARDLLASHRPRRLCGQTLFLADDTDAILLEVDPPAGRIRIDEGALGVRTNHFVRASSTQTESSTARRERALQLLGGRSHLDRDDLWSVARDHVNGPGDESICRHPEPETDDTNAFGQLTTASTTIFEGGSPAIDVGLGNPCEADRTRCAFGDEVPTDLRTGQRWLDRRT